MSDPTVPRIIPIPNKQVKDITGQRFGRLVALGYVGTAVIGKSQLRRAEWLCRCDCGAEIVIDGGNLRSGNSKSCGCRALEIRSKNGKGNTTHGMKGTPEYAAWCNLRGRCLNPNDAAYDRYGGRGIMICQGWRDSFENFYADMGPRPGPAYSLDRIDNNGPYSPENCRWATPRQQTNNKRDNQLISFQGETHTIGQWARISGINYFTLWSRLRQLGWTIERALTEIP